MTRGGTRRVRIVGLFGPDPVRLTLPEVRGYLRQFVEQRQRAQLRPYDRAALIELDRRIGLLRDALHAEGCCRECGRTLTDPGSVLSGIGPDCRRRLEATS